MTTYTHERSWSLSSTTRESTDEESDSREVLSQRPPQGFAEDALTDRSREEFL